jgi:Domain of unknown function (DUF4382)
MDTRKMTRTVAVTALLLAGAACSKSGQLSVSARAQTSADAGTSSGSLDLGQGISVSEVKAVVKRITLHLPESGTADGGADGGGDDMSSHGLTASGSPADQGGGGHDGEGEIENEAEDDEVKVGPFLVDLKGDALASKTLSTVFDGDVPAGTYREIKIVIAPDTSVAADGSSVTIAGTLDAGTATAKDFTFTSRLHAAQRIETDVTVSASGTQNVTLTIDPSGWFKDSAGNRLDPTDASNQSQIEGNIRRSIKGFCDHDRNGEDDRNEHGGNDGPGHG